ncbi:MAG: hypothetical protein AABX61_00830 [Nanoarchaeota archaeon]
MIRFWYLPEDRNYILLNDTFKNKITEILKNKNYPYKLRNKFMSSKISLKIIKKISNDLEIPLETFEKNITWIGGSNSRGLSKPKLPFNLESREGSRFIAGIINDGCLTKDGEESYGRLMYDNFDKTLRDSMINNYLSIFGGNPNEISFRNYEKKKYLEFSSVIRDIIHLIIKEKGPKSESNLSIPSFILNDKEAILGWIEQAIADEGNVNYNLNKYRREIVWRRSLDVTPLFNSPINKEIPFKKLPLNIQKLLYKQKCKLIEEEKKILDLLGISYNEYNIGVYPTNKGKIRTRWQISITKRENLIKLRKLIKIPSKEKDKKFSLMCNEFQRYKEPLKIKNAIIRLGKNKKIFTSIDLKLSMKYKNISATHKWLRIFGKQGIIEKVKESTHRKPAEYKLTPNK